MSFKVKFLPDAQSDAREIIDWYEEQQNDLGVRFLASLSVTLILIGESPMIFQKKYREVRQAPVNDFPILVHYLVEEENESVVVLAVMHSARDPQVWRKRT
jgi:plasmid stabilization system protein ParE